MKQRRYHRKQIVFTFANGAAGAGLIQSEAIHFEGELLNILQVNGANTGTRTAQITIEDIDGNVIFDGTAKAHNASHNHEFGVTIRRILAAKNTVKCTISGDPGVSGYTVTVYVGLIGYDG